MALGQGYMYSIMRQKITESRSTTLSPGHSQFFMLPALGGYKSTNLIYIEGDCYQSAQQFAEFLRHVVRIRKHRAHAQYEHDQIHQVLSTPENLV